MDLSKIYFENQRPDEVNTCKRCNSTWPLSAEFWSVRKQRHNGQGFIALYPYCKKCQKEINHEQYENRKDRENGTLKTPAKGTCDCCGAKSQKRVKHGDKAVCTVCKYILDQGDLEEGLKIFALHVAEEDFLDAQAAANGRARNWHTNSTTINTDEFKSHTRCLRIYNSLQHAIQFDKSTKV